MHLHDTPNCSFREESAIVIRPNRQYLIHQSNWKIKTEWVKEEKTKSEPSSLSARELWVTMYTYLKECDD
jgi:hypothetical protein